MYVRNYFQVLVVGNRLHPPSPLTPLLRNEYIKADDYTQHAALVSARRSDTATSPDVHIDDPQIR